MIFDGFEPVSFLENENLPLPFWKIAYLGKCSFSECYGNAEIGWMTFELLLIWMTQQKEKQPSKVEDSGVHWSLARVIRTRLGRSAKKVDFVKPFSRSGIAGQFAFVRSRSAKRFNCIWDAVLLLLKNSAEKVTSSRSRGLRSAWAVFYSRTERRTPRRYARGQDERLRWDGRPSKTG